MIFSAANERVGDIICTGGRLYERKSDSLIGD